jgi:plasmid maintenance system killer protein
MDIIKTTEFERTLKRFLRKNVLTSKIINETIILFQTDKSSTNLHFKKINCKSDKNRYSIRLLNSSYRLLMTIENDTAFLRCICDHDDYDRRNKGC